MPKKDTEKRGGGCEVYKQMEITQTEQEIKQNKTITIKVKEKDEFVEFETRK